MNLRLSNDARPQAMTLLVATAISLLLWFIPFAWILYYPFELFVTFIHEGGHALAAVLTGGSVDYMWVATDTQGLTVSRGSGGAISRMLVSSAGYLGAMAYGALLLVLIRKAVAARIVLLVSGIYIFLITMVFGFIKPLWSFDGLSGIPFTLVAGIAISAALILIARFASARVAAFFMSFLAVQCVLNALFNLKDLLSLSAPFQSQLVHTDAGSMASITGIPAIFWAAFWIVLALGILWFVMRLYVAGRDKGFQPDLPFEEAPPAETYSV
ncbi:MAG TPA: M50 family metallopeptidase [Pyrinomonadaceae bacterium]|nr:M50 family metallopeptidase [Pyrinomonadaceae bacterium]